MQYCRKNIHHNVVNGCHDYLADGICLALTMAIYRNKIISDA
jgi:hypothetical protein